MLELLIIVLFTIIGIVFSIWNSYNAGKIYAYRKGLGIVVYTLGGFLPISYIISIILAIILSSLNYISTADTTFLLSFSFLFFGLAIVMWGVIATTLSAIATMKGRSWKAGLVTAYNAFATIWDALDYISNFMSALGSMMKSSKSNNFSIVIVIAVLAIAIGIGLIISYVAFKEGLKSEKRRIKV